MSLLIHSLHDVNRQKNR